MGCHRLEMKCRGYTAEAGRASARMQSTESRGRKKRTSSVDAKGRGQIARARWLGVVRGQWAADWGQSPGAEKGQEAHDED